ncbi:ABC transporter permease [Halorientalis regularis]|uniref:Uncharacterized protein n=1 Tax=Halorientalis regularis TaxID=660518 RepID=A0A1G7L234_9EURY|nr:hypothetical protein SAMN05216218_106129 [Halorientalis regularis]
MSSLLDRIREYFGPLNAALLAIGSISLVVAGVSIVNVMLMSTSERNVDFLVLAFCFGVGTSLRSGLYPAWKTANRRPVEALNG